MLRKALLRLQTRRCPVWYHPSYRLPLPGVQARSGLDRRRADLVMWWMEDAGLVSQKSRRTPERISCADLSQVHSDRWMEQSCTAEALAEVFAVDPWEVPVDGLLDAVRLAAGATVAAAREALERGGPCLNLSGGFHHARPDSGAGFCVYNDIAVTIARLRADGVGGRVGILDLDAHPPDGTAACHSALGPVWIGSISGSDWGQLPGTAPGPGGAWLEEHVIPGADDRTYLACLDAMLDRMPSCGLWLVLAGGDVLAGDPLGRLGLSMEGAWARDRRVADRLAGQPSVWMPGGGYREDAWRVLAGTAWALMRPGSPQIPDQLDPLAHHFRRVSSALSEQDLGSRDIDLSDLAQDLNMAPAQPVRFLGFYTRAGMEHALHRLGVLSQLEQLGYRDLRIDFAAGNPGELVTLTGRFHPGGGTPGTGHPGVAARLVEVSLEQQQIPGAGRVLFVHWLTLRHPKTSFREGRPQLPGQEQPGLGMAREAGALLARMAERLGLDGVALRPAWFHIAWASRSHFRFQDPALHARFLAMARDLPALFPGPAGFNLSAASRAVAAGEIGVSTDGGPWAPLRWEPGLMVSFKTHSFKTDNGALTGAPVGAPVGAQAGHPAGDPTGDQPDPRIRVGRVADPPPARLSGER